MEIREIALEPQSYELFVDILERGRAEEMLEKKLRMDGSKEDERARERERERAKKGRRAS